jgi:DDE superfamily endonuclease
MLSSGLRKVIYLYAAVRPATDDAFALVLPEVNANTMDIFLDRFAACLAQNAHAIVLLDQAGWHGEKALAVPVGGAIHSIKSIRIPLPHELSRTQGGSRRIAL